MRRTVWLLVLILILGVATVVRAEEAVWAEYPASNYAPGPGWPQGWSPPPTPTGLPEGRQEWLKETMAKYPQYTKWELHILDPLPAWTQEYPYWWEFDYTMCGNTIYLYWYPYPDAGLVEETWGRNFGGGRTISDACRMEPTHFIVAARERPEELVQADLRLDQFIDDMDASNGSLSRAFGDGVEGSPEAVAVFFNSGFASRTFDVPAYLDTRVSRVRVPVRFVSELMGAQVDWESATGQVRIHFAAVSREINRVVPAPGESYETLFPNGFYYPDSLRFRLQKQTVSLPARTIILTMGKPEALVNGQPVPLDAPPVEIQGRTMVPLRFVSEQLGAKVYWVGDQPVFPELDGSLSGTYQVHIFTPFYPLFDYPSPYLERSAASM